MSFFPSPWKGIATTLDVKYDKDYFYYQKFKHDNFLASLVPDTEDFFGTKVFNIFIAQRPYGWKECGGPNQRQFQWPPDGFQESLDRYLLVKDRFASFKTYIWVDYWTALENRTINPASDWVTMMDDTNAAIEAFCTATPGFTYMGKIESQVEPNFFFEQIEEFFGTPAYKRQP